MATQPTKLFAKAKPKTQEQTMSLFKKRQAQRGVNFTDVSMANLVLFLTACVRENIGIGIYSASGGRGVCLKLYTGKKQPDTEYASTAEEFDELISNVLETLGELADDSEEADAAD
jgi:hypothetical protein